MILLLYFDQNDMKGSMIAIKPCNDISWSSGALEIFKNSAFVYSLAAHIECIPHIVRRKRRRVETFQIVGETFFPILGISRALKSVWKVLWFLHIAHCTPCRPTKPTGQAITCAQRTNNRSLRNSWGAPTFTNIRTNYAKMFDVSTPTPYFTYHTTVSSTKDIKRVNKNTRRLLAVTGPCSWMRHNFSQFPR